MVDKTQTYEDDDGRVICNMDVEGMPWYNRRSRLQPQTEGQTPRGEPLTRSETQRFIWNAVLAGLLIVGVMAASWVLIVLFLIHVWAR